MSGATPSSLRLWADNPTALDLLGFADIAQPVLEAVARERLDPVAVGVFGDWGSGKTTVLEIINADLKDKKGTLVVYTRPWEYDPTLDARATLITEVLETLRERVKEDETAWDKTKNRFAELAKRIKWSKAITLAGRSAVTLTLPDPEKLIDLFGAGEEVVDPTLQGFRHEFAELMDELEGMERVIVLVDDLDRCLPETVVMTLEAIKLFLSVKKMAFVIAADEAPIKAAIARHFDRDERGVRMAADYLEKIVQIPVTVPALGEGDTEAYLAMMLLDQHLGGDEKELAKIAAHCTERRQAAEENVLEGLDNLPDEAGPDLALAAELAPVLYQRLAGNPRRLKRFLNAFWIRGDIAARRGIELDPPTLAKLMVLERIEEDAFGKLLDWLGEGKLSEELKRIEEAEEAEGPFSWWAKLPPKLATTNLGPYLRLAAALRRRSGPRADLRPDLAALLVDLASSSSPERNAALKRLAELPDTDKLVMAREVVDAIRRDSSSQETLAEAIAQFLAEGELVEAIAERLAKLDASRIEPALIVTISEVGQSHEAIVAVVKEWSKSMGISDISKNAIETSFGGA